MSQIKFRYKLCNLLMKVESSDSIKFKVNNKSLIKKTTFNHLKDYLSTNLCCSHGRSTESSTACLHKSCTFINMNMKVYKLTLREKKAH